MKLKVIKDCYYITDNAFYEGEYLSHEEVIDRLVHMLCKDDIWETSIDDPELFVCTSGDWEGEFNEGWWEYEDLKSYFEEID